MTGLMFKFLINFIITIYINENMFHCVKTQLSTLSLSSSLPVMILTDDFLLITPPFMCYYSSNQGKYSDAEVLFKQCLDKQKIAIGENHPDTLNSLNS